MKLVQKKKYENLISIATIVYGFVFIITDIFHYFYGVQATIDYNQSGIMGFFIPYEPLEIKIYNSFIHILLIIAGFSFYKRKPITWHFYNIAFIALILKSPTLFFWDLYYRPNWIALTGLPYIFSIVGLIYFNKEKVKRKIHYTHKRNKIRIVFFIVITFTILGILSYNIWWTPRKQIIETLDNAIVKNKKSIYIHHIKNILDTLDINLNNIHGVGVSILGSENKPVYIEKLQIGDFDLLCYPYIYDSKGNLVQEFDSNPSYNNIIYEYDSLNRLIVKKFCLDPQYFGYQPQDTVEQENCCGVFYKFRYLGNKIEEVGFRSENDPFLKYELELDLKEQIISRKVINGYSHEGDTYYFYDENGRKIKSEEYNAQGQLWKKELIYYQEGKLTRKEEFVYGRSSLSEKLMNLIKFKSYTAKYITYYYHEGDSLICKK